MVSVRRWYVFLVSAISLQAVAWAAIYLLRGLLPPGPTAPATTIALQIAIIVVGLPFFLVHWLWAQRLASRDADERASDLRQIYLYAMLGAFLAPFVYHVFELVMTLLGIPLGTAPVPSYLTPPSPIEVIADDLIAMVVLALLFAYHQLVLMQDTRAAPQVTSSVARRLYIILFSATGLTMMALALVQILRWLMYQIGGQGSSITGSNFVLAVEAARLFVGLPLWLVFWLQAQVLFHGANESERESALRKLYLYLVVSSASILAVTNATLMLAGFIRQALGLPSAGDVRDPLSIILIVGVVWAYHAFVLNDDVGRAALAPRQAALRRLYSYLVAAVGLAALLGGLAGDVSVLIQTLAGNFFGDGLKEQLAFSTAALIAGLPVWILPWRRAQNDASLSLRPFRSVPTASLQGSATSGIYDFRDPRLASGDASEAERRSVVRKTYLYFYLFVATMTVLGSAIYILFRLVSLVLGEPAQGNLLSDLGHALAFSLIAIGVWLYHGWALRGDGKLAQREKAERLAATRVAVVDAGDGQFGRAMMDELKRELPGLVLQPLGLTTPLVALSAPGVTGEQGPSESLAPLKGANLIVAPWDIAMVSGKVSGEIARAILANPARKLLVPMHVEGFDLVGVEDVNLAALAQDTAHTVKQIVEGEEVKPTRRLGMSSGVAILIGLVGLCILIEIVQAVLSFFLTLR